MERKRAEHTPEPGLEATVRVRVRVRARVTVRVRVRVRTIVLSVEG